MPSNHFVLCCPLLLLPSVFPSLNVFSSESALCIRWPNYWSFSFNISPSNEDPGLISFRMDWLDLLAVQGTLKSLLQHHSSKASILQCAAFFTVQLLHPYMTTGKTIALTRRTFIEKVMPLLLNMLSRLVITFLPRSKSLLISWLQSPSAVILEPKEIKTVTVSTVSPLPRSDGIFTLCKESYDQPRQHIKKQRHYFANKGPSSQVYGFLVVRYGCESWTIKKAKHWRIDAFELWCWRWLLRVPWTARRSNQSILKEISPGCSLERLMLKLKLQ